MERHASNDDHRTRDDGGASDRPARRSHPAAVALRRAPRRRRSRMALRFDRKTRSFARPERHTMPVAGSAQALLDEVVGGYPASTWAGNGFNDLGLYLQLCAEDGSPRVEIDSIDVHHNESWCFGIRVVYRLKFADGSIARRSAPNHVYSRGYYSYAGGPRKMSVVELEEGEFIAEIRTRQGEITDQIALLTNRRTMTFGGSGGSGEDMSRPIDLSRRIVAFVGTSNGVLERLGAVSVSRNWEVVGPIVLLRALVERGRASRIEGDSSLTEEGGDIVRSFVAEASEDVFKRTLSFLAYGVDFSN